MDTSDSFIVVEGMIRRGEPRLAELEHLLEILVAQEHITNAECKALLELATKLNTEQLKSKGELL